jgi:hypothetical protein
MQIINWPVISSMASHEAFQWISKKLFDDSVRISFVYSQYSGIKNQKDTDLKYLSQRAYHRNKHLYCASEGLDSNFHAVMGAENLPTLAFDTKFEWSSSNIVNSRIIVTKSHTSKPSFSLESLLFGIFILRGISSIRIETMRLTEWCNIADGFVNNWLDLYNYLRNNSYEPINKTLLLSFFAYKGLAMDYLLFLQRILHNNGYFF